MTLPRSSEQQRVDKLDEAWLVSMLKSAQERGFHGELNVTLYNGSVKKIDTRQSFVPPHAKS